jgi:hypothetical protein
MNPPKLKATSAVVEVRREVFVGLEALCQNGMSESVEVAIDYANKNFFAATAFWIAQNRDLFLAGVAGSFHVAGDRVTPASTLDQC